MKQNVSPGVIAVVVVVLIAGIGFAAFKMFGSKSPSGTALNATQEATRKAAMDKMAAGQPNMKSFTRDNPPPQSGGGGGAAH